MMTVGISAILAAGVWEQERILAVLILMDGN
jgi:hypothetical protein